MKRSLIIFLLLCLSVYCYGEDFSAKTDNYKIAYKSKQGGDYEIFIMNPDGSAKTQITDNEINDHDPAWSCDGTKLAYISEVKEKNKIIYYNLMIYDLAANNSMMLYEKCNGPFWWSPDGEKILFHDIQSKGRLCVVNVNSKELTYLTDENILAGKPSWSPDGSKVMFITKIDKKLSIYTVNSDGSDLKTITDGVAEYLFADWSPDSQQIVYCWMHGSMFTSTKHEIHLINADGTNQTAIFKAVQKHSKSSSYNRNVIWSPDDKKIAYSHLWYDGKLYIYEVCMQNTDELGKEIMVSKHSGPRDYGELQWSPDATKLAFYYNYSIFIEDVSQKKPRKIKRTPSLSSPVWSPDNKSVYFCSNPSALAFRKTAIFKYDLESGEIIKLTGGPNDGLPACSPILPAE